MGEGALALERAKSVFINCPFDRDFQSHHDAIILTVVCCGFMPRSAVESGNVSVSRMERIMGAIYGSKYSIHDLTRCRGEGDENLARFNMPLELGVAMSRRYSIRRPADRHDWLVLVPRGHAYGKFISDLTGFDPRTHDGSVEGVVTEVSGWLATRHDVSAAPPPQVILDLLPHFRTALDDLRRTWGQNPPWADIVLSAKKIGAALEG